MHKQSHKNLRKLHSNTLAESIDANSFKHKLNERDFLKGLEETKMT